MALDIPEMRIAEFCRKWGIIELALFGSAVRADFGPDSDIDALVTFVPEARHGLFNLARMKGELEAIFDRDVDILTRRAVENSRNPIRRKAILDSAQVIYAA
jgi:hypothetical protein